MYGCSVQALHCGPLMVITRGHSQPILSSSFQGDFSLTLDNFHSLFSFFHPRLSFWGSAEQLLEMSTEFTYLHCLGSFALMAIGAACNATCWGIWPLCPRCHCPEMCPPPVCLHVWSRLVSLKCLGSPICRFHFQQASFINTTFHPDKLGINQIKLPMSQKVKNNHEKLGVVQRSLK